jgi:hypothetical protein
VALVVLLVILGSASAAVGLSGALSGSKSNPNQANASLAVGPQLSVETTTPTTEPPLPGAGAPGYFNSVTCASVSLCITVGGGVADVGLIDRSTNGAKSFSSVPVPKGTQRLSAVACSDALHCVAVGIGTLLYTSDGGVGWSLTTPPVSQTLFLGASCASALRCIAVGMRPRPAQPDGGVLLVSDNAGKTWTNSSYPNLTPGIGSVSCPSATTCIAVGGTVLVSNDAGATWVNRAVPDGIQPLSSISCSTAKTCVALGPDTEAQTNPSLSAIAIETTDAGANFEHLSLPPGSGYAVSISCKASTCNALGADPTGKFPTVGFWSSDSGTNWSTSSPYPPASQLRGLYCPSTSQCIAVGRSNAHAVAFVSTSLGPWTKAAMS